MGGRAPRLSGGRLTARPAATRARRILLRAAGSRRKTVRKADLDDAAVQAKTSRLGQRRATAEGLSGLGADVTTHTEPEGPHPLQNLSMHVARDATCLGKQDLQGMGGLGVGGQQGADLGVTGGGGPG